MIPSPPLANIATVHLRRGAESVLTLARSRLPQSIPKVRRKVSERSQGQFSHGVDSGIGPWIEIIYHNAHWSRRLGLRRNLSPFPQIAVEPKSVAVLSLWVIL